MGHGWEGVVLKLLRGKDFTFTVTGAEQVTDRFRRVRLTDGGMLARTGVHPTMWVRIWFDNGGRPHQRAYTLVDPDPVAGTFSLEFALHDGCASDWARAARPGDTVEATLQGTGFTAPAPPPGRLLVVGDPASLPAVNSLLDAFPGVPATLWFETSHRSDERLPIRLDDTVHDVRRVPREDGGRRLVDEVVSALPALLDGCADPYLWIACDTATTRALAGYARKELGLPKERVDALGYWRAA
ncbi:siderophore-interacting protein [Streptomyces clavuligerus]|uniref:Siderophore-interacting protein n=1 Tax=Streptomyces clavuligerus TaxID=1901 RepID=B5H472_STRCL|nr:siderophore-interacting protein [Streptomyces clavuligerus]ANW21600.1 NADPH-dependent ferric siderophore reductase [Streptomyces clavuligerus]AXU16226.1 siderophore-interacting protein [Streptomyces clavuligerus]EDY53368.1 siderophore-interacting protein [Streptomyces clavuligerus]EFG05226.1 Siderophore-interacting protein [Streptomyces clavuligerus]MBY6306384.1 siderophore-interacting protein [Streptomyces clavuligerus]